MNQLTYLFLFSVFVTGCLIQSSEACMEYKTVLYSRTESKKIPANITGEVRNVTENVGGDGSGGKAPIAGDETMPGPEARRRKRDDTWVLNGGYDELTRALKNAERRVAAGHIGRGKGSCNRVVRHKLATTISSSCLGYKAKFIHSWPWNSFNKCCQAIRDDPECSGKFFVYPVTGSCVCEKIGEECPRQFGFSTELHLM